MSISETTLADNRGTDSGIESAGRRRSRISASSSSSVEAAREIVSLAEEIRARVMSAAQKGDSFDETERAVWNSMLQIGNQAMGLFVALQGVGDLGPQVQPESGKPLIRSENPTPAIVRSVFGEHHFEQYTYSVGKGKTIELRPISARMSLPPCRWSPLLQEFSQIFCVDQAYGQAAANLQVLLNDKFSVDTVEAINLNMGRSAVEFVRRWCLHILPAAFTKTRCYGGWSNHHYQRYVAECRTLQSSLSGDSNASMTNEPVPAAAPISHAYSCPDCGEGLELLERGQRYSWLDIFSSCSNYRPHWYKSWETSG